MPSDLLERLRQVEPEAAAHGRNEDGVTRWYRNPDGPEAARRIEELEAALAEEQAESLRQAEIARDALVEVEQLEHLGYIQDSICAHRGRVISELDTRVEELEAEAQRLHQWVLAESGGTSLTPNTVDAAILIGTERGREMESAQKERDFWEAANTRTLEMLPAFTRRIEELEATLGHLVEAADDLLRPGPGSLDEDDVHFAVAEALLRAAVADARALLVVPRE